METIQQYILLNWKELTAAFFGLIYVLLAARQNVLCWFSGIINVVIYAWIFYDQRIYANMTLQIIYLIISIYGIYSWIKKKKGRTAEIKLLDNSYRYFILVLFIILIGIIYLALENKDSNMIMFDAATTAAGIIATWMQARKFIENWLVWIPTDIILTIMFITQELYVTAGLFAIYTFLAIYAYLKWKKVLKTKLVTIA